MASLAANRRAFLVVRLDRPSPEVIGVLDRAVAELPFEDTLYIQATSPTRGGTNWAYSCVELWDAARLFCETDVAMLWDDDVVFTAPALREMRAHLDFFTEDRVDARWAMCTGDEKTEDLNFPAHFATAAFRCYPDDTWSTDRVQHAPAHVADSKKSVVLKHPLLHLGYLSQDDREEAWEAARASGKIDAHSLALTKEPRTCPVE